MASFNNIDLEESATVTKSVASITIARGSTTEHQEILCLGDPDSSLGIAAVTNAAPESTRFGLNVRIVSGPSTLADFAVRAVLPSTATDNPVVVSTGHVTVDTGSIQVSAFAAGAALASVSSLSTGHVTVDTGSLRVHQSTAADLNVTVAGYSTTVNVSSLAGRVDVGDYSTGVPTSNVRSLVVRQISTGGGASSTQVSVSTGSVRVHQSTAADLLVTVSPNSTAAPASNDTGVIVRQVGYSTTANVSSLAGRVLVDQNSTVWPVQVSSVAGQVSVGEYSTAAPATGSTGLVVRQVGYSTTANVSSVAGRVLTDQNSTVWQTQSKIQDSSGVSPNIVGTRPTTGAQGLAVRTVLNDIQSTTFSTIGNNSTSSTIVSSAASVRHKVFAYSITSTMNGGAANTISFASSLANPLWSVVLRAISSGITGANLAVSPPAWLFATEAASPLVFKVTGATGTYHLAFSYFSEA